MNMVISVDLSHFPTAPVTPQKNAAICQSHSEYRVATVYSLISLWNEEVTDCEGA